LFSRKSDETLTVRTAARLALARAGLLKPAWTGLPSKTPASERAARRSAHGVIRRFGYLQLDTVSVAGARSHGIALLSRLEGFDPALAERLLLPGEPLFEYWGHEVSWIPLELYPLFEFRRKAFRTHPWWGDLIGRHPETAENLRRRVREEGPIRSLDMEGGGSRGWWDLKPAKKVATALWSSGEFAIPERTNFQRSFDLAERVIPARLREHPVPEDEALERLLLLALEGHGWASPGTLARTWRLTNRKKDLDAALRRLAEKGAAVPCRLAGGGKPLAGWIRPEDLELAGRLERVRPRRDRGVLLSPFDPVLWDRERTLRLLGFHQILEIFKPAPMRTYGYYCMPVLAGDRLAARADLKADAKAGRLRVLSLRFEGEAGGTTAASADREAARTALERYARALDLGLEG